MKKLKKLAKDICYFEDSSLVVLGANIDNPKTREEAWKSCEHGADMLFVLAHGSRDVAVQAATKIIESGENIVEQEFVELAKVRLNEAKDSKESPEFKLLNVSYIMARACCNGPCHQTKGKALAQMCDSCWEIRKKALKHHAEIIRQMQPTCPNIV